MRPRDSIKRNAAIAALSCAATFVPVAGWTHWEGFAAADPSTPAALLRFDSAAADYVAAQVSPESWLARFEVHGGPAQPGQPPIAEAGTGERDAVGTGEHSGHTGVEQPAPATLPE